MKMNTLFLYVFLGVLLASLLFLSVTFGETALSFNEVFQTLMHPFSTRESVSSAILFQLRLPRALLAFITGSGLALSGCIMQSCVRNPLADPYTLGISSGASVGASFALLIGFSSESFFGNLGISGLAFIGAMTVSLCVLFLSKKGNGENTTTLLLSGLLMASVANAVTNFILFTSSNTDGIKTVTFWLMGSLAGASWQQFPLLYFFVFLSFLFFWSQSRTLNLLLLGEIESFSLGVDVVRYRRIYLVIISVVTSLLVSNTGMIGFVGLIVPHVARGIVGSFHERLLPFVTIFGGIFLLFCDLISRVLIEKTALPIGVITALIGAPFLLFLLFKNNQTMTRGRR